MEDKDIIKALECCSDNTMDVRDDCPRIYDNGLTTVECMCKLMRDALDLINRQKAEIERLKNDLGKEFTCFVGSPHKVESCPFFDELENERAEAVKEFEERAIKNICEKVYAPTPVQSCIVEKCNQVIVETAKEMAGEG